MAAQRAVKFIHIDGEKMTAKEDNATITGIIISIIGAVGLNYFGYNLETSIFFGILAGIIGGITVYYISENI